MILSNTLSLCLLDHDQNEVYNHNIHLMQDLMCSGEPDGAKVKRVCADFPNIALLTKIAMPSDIQVIFCHAFFGDECLGETVTAFYLARSFEYMAVVSINANRAFARTGKKIRLITTEVFLCADVGNLACSNKLRYWALLKTAPPPRHSSRRRSSWMTRPQQQR